MHVIKRIFSTLTGYWIHKISSMPIGADLYLDIHKRIGYGTLNTMFDVGANIGQTWESFRDNEASAKIYCFEPVLKPYLLLRNKVGNDLASVLENIAFGEIEGEKIIRLFSDDSRLNSLKNGIMNPDTNSKEEKIKIDTLDNYCFKNNIPKIDFLKIDTEGYELNVLEGARKMLSNGNISFIYGEVGFGKENKRNTYFSELTEWLAVHDYYFYALYQLSMNDWKTEFGNALFVHKSILINDK